MLNTINDDICTALDALRRVIYALSAASAECRRQGERLPVADNAVKALDAAVDCVEVVFKAIVANGAAEPVAAALASDVESALRGLGAAPATAQAAARAASGDDFDSRLRSALAMVTGR
jgi:hypothetical protein